MESTLSPRRRTRVLSVGIAATASLYLLAAFVAEPLRALATTETAVVSVTLASGIGLGCDANGGRHGSGETLNLGTITYSGDVGAYSDNRAVKCHVFTNNTAGYTLTWRVTTGSGGQSTGHLINEFEDIIQAFGTGSASNYTKTWSVGASESRWGGRVSSTSSGTTVGNMDFGTDASSEKWARVKTGTALTIRSTSAESQSGSGDLIKIGFRAEVGSLKSQATGTYKATVSFTAATQ